MESNYKSRVQSNAELRTLARRRLEGKWGLAALAILVYVVIYIGIESIPVPMPTFKIPFLNSSAYWSGYYTIPIFTTLVDGAFGLGLALYHLQIAKNRDTNISNIFYGFKFFVQAAIAGVLIWIITILGFALFIIPGIIALLGMSFTYYIMADNPEMKATEALTKSWEMTKGHKMQLLFMAIYFIVLMFLSVFTLFIGLFWLLPYMQVSFANFYLQIRGEAADEFEIGDHLIEMT